MGVEWAADGLVLGGVRLPRSPEQFPRTGTVTPRLSSEGHRDLPLLSRGRCAGRLVWKAGCLGETHKPRLMIKSVPNTRNKSFIFALNKYSSFQVNLLLPRCWVY